MSVTEVTHHMALLPLAVLVMLLVRGERRDAAWWWLAGVFLVSWLTDTVAEWVSPAARWMLSTVYPLSQAALVALVVLPRRTALWTLGGLTAVALGAVVWRGTGHPDLLLRTAAWGSIVGLVWDRPALGALRTALLVSFGSGLLAWYGYALAPNWTSWGCYQGVRALGLGWFCVALWRPRPRLRVA